MNTNASPLHEENPPESQVQAAGHLEPDFALLLCTNGNPTSRPALQYGAWLARLLHKPVTLLGIIEAPQDSPWVNQQIAAARLELDEAGIDSRVLLETGEATAVMDQVAASANYLTVFGPLGRPAWRRVLQGRTFRHILEKIESPLLYVPQSPDMLSRILICLGGLGYAHTVEHLAIYLARQAGANITLLHVVEPVGLEYPISREINRHWREVLTTDTPQGRNLRQAMADAEQAGLNVEFKVRHGSALEEIQTECRQGMYDLVVLGSPYSTHSLRQRYRANITAHVAETLAVPTLTARSASTASKDT